MEFKDGVNSDGDPRSAGEDMRRHGVGPSAAIDPNIPIHRYTHYSGEFGETAYPMRRVRARQGTVIWLDRLWRVEHFNPEEFGTSWEWEVI